MMQTPHSAKPRLFVDADVLFAGSASPSEHSASLVILRMAEITLIEAFASEQVITEVERNLSAKMPEALPKFRYMVSRCLQIVPDPSLTAVTKYRGRADAKDLPILVAAVRENCSWLVTFNVKDFQPGLVDLTVLRPGNFILHVRDLLMQLT
ncbi:MAG: PIN domain-containing protein [Chloroflexi bacterium]|nr:PIN domain-containing protein [Chloroflexota bacterium]